MESERPPNSLSIIAYSYAVFFCFSLRFYRTKWCSNTDSNYITCSACSLHSRKCNQFWNCRFVVGWSGEYSSYRCRHCLNLDSCCFISSSASRQEATGGADRGILGPVSQLLHQQVYASHDCWSFRTRTCTPCCWRSLHAFANTNLRWTSLTAWGSSRLSACASIRFRRLVGRWSC